MGEWTFTSRHISRHNLNSWDEFPVMGTGILWAGGAGNSPFSWYVRSLPNIKSLFAAVWEGETNLVASMDGCGLFRPTVTGIGEKRVFHPEWITKSAWFHVDQNPHNKPNKECVQGLFSVFDQDEHTGGLVVIPGSHHGFQSLRNLVKSSSTGDFVNVPSGHFLLDEGAGAQRPKLVKCKAGDFILWDSRLIHCNAPARRDQIFMAKNPGFAPQKSAFTLFIKELGEEVFDAFTSLVSAKSKIPPRLQRLVSYQCMTPFSKIHPKAVPLYRKGRLEAVHNGTTTNHWPHEFSGGPTIRSGDKLMPIQLTPYQRELVVGKE